MKKRITRLNTAAAVAACSILFFLPAMQGRAAVSQVISGHVPRLAAGLQPLHRMEGTNRLRLAINLPLRDKAGLSNLFDQIYDPTSPNYRHFLTSDQFTQRFGPTVADYEALKAFAASNNLTVADTHPNRTLLDVTGSAADIERAFNIKMQVYKHPTKDRTFYAPDTEPTVNLNVPILHIFGLENSVLPFPKMKVSKNTVGQPRGSGSGPGGNYQGYDFRDAYVPGVSLTGGGQSVSLFELDGYFASDVSEYLGQTGLPNVPLVNILVDGFNGVPQTLDGDGEVTLDIDMAIAMAPGISNVFVYEGFTPEDILNKIATDNRSRQISCSWGWEPFPSSTDQIFQQFGVQGQSFFNASGDDGADTQPQLVFPPSDDPYITEVGGTTLTTTGPLGKWASETVWSWFAAYGQPAASSGGISFTYPIPTWQQGINMTTNGGSITFRNYPDVALTADNIYIITDLGVPQPGTGGTSCAAPLWAGFMAMVNEQAAANCQPPLGFVNPAIYALAKSTSYGSTFHDITTGNDTNFTSPTKFYAYPGYDLCTGWGTPNGSNLMNALAPASITPVFAIVTNTITGGNGNGVIDFNECNNLSILLTNESCLSTATGVQVTLTSTTTGAIVAQGTSAYPPLTPFGSGANLIPFTISTEPTFVCGTPINLTLVIKSDQISQTNSLQLSSGTVGSPDTFTSSTVFTIPNSTPTPVNSPLVVTGLQSVGKLTVSVCMTALYDSGISLKLVAPNGTNVLLTQGNGGFSPNFGVSCGVGSETVFDDAAGTTIGLGTPPYVGSFQPQQALSTFRLDSGTNLNGIWNLQVVDSFPGDTAQLLCWSLNVSPEVCVDGGGQCSGADLSLTMSGSPNPVFVNSNLVYNLTVSNAGPSTADGVVVVQSLPAGVGFVTTSNYPVTVSQSGSNLDLGFGSLPVYGTATVSIVTIATIPGYATSGASVGSQENDPIPANNSASATVLVTEPTADVGVTMTGSPASILEGGLVTYTIHVTNNGPFMANGVSLATTLPANANFVSATTSQGTISGNGALENLGSIGIGTNVTISIVVTPNVTGTLTASTVATITNAEVDPISFNNTASASVTVGPAADLGVTAFATPSPVVGGSNFSYIITISNAGPAASTSQQFSQSLPTAATYVTNTLAGAFFSNGLVSFNFTNPLPSGGSILFTDIFKAPILLPGVQSQNMSSTISVFGQPGDPNSNNNVLTLQTLAEVPTETIVAAGATVISGSSNGAIGPTGTYGVEFFLLNVGTIPSTNLTATLLNSNGVTLASGAQSYGMLTPSPASGPTGKTFTFTANSTNGGTITAMLQLTDGSTSLGTVSFTFTMPIVHTFWNTNLISIPTQADIPQPDAGPANPYPSTIPVTNVTLNVSTVTVTISNLYHTYPNDIGLLLVGPTGANCVLMSAAAQYTTMSSAATVTFDPNAAILLPDDEQIVTATYRPADYFTMQNGITETYTNSPIPTGPYNTNLSTFASLSANGTWSLYAFDFSAGDAGAISNGWGLTFTTITPVNQVADLAAGFVASTNQIVLGNYITNTWTVTNNGPNAAYAYLTNIMPAGLTFVGNMLPIGATSTQTGQTNLINIGNLQSGASVSITNVVLTALGGKLTNTVIAGSFVIDNNLANNTATAVTLVTYPPVDLSVGPISVSANPVVVNSNAVYTLWITNNGPSNALNVVAIFTNSSSFSVVGANVSHGNYSVHPNYVQFNLGLLSNGSPEEILLTNTLLTVGTTTNGWSVTNTAGTDTNLANNATNILVSVVLPTPVITNGAATLLSQAAPPYNGAINSGQTNTVSFTFLNLGAGATTNLVATLVSNSNIRPITLSNTYGAIPPGSFAAKTFTFVGTGSSGAGIIAQFNLKDGSNTNLPPVLFTFWIPMMQIFSNTNAITIPYQGPASPYPAIIPVSGMTNSSTNLLVSKMTVTLSNFAHTWPHDVSAIAVSPTGQEVALMEHTGSFFSVSNVVLTFDDSATNHLPLSNSLPNNSSGTFLATEYAPFDNFPGLAPVATNSPGLSSFNGMNPNGAWSLYVYDDSAGNNGYIANGWSMAITAISPVNPAALLSLSTLEAPSPAIDGDYVNYEVIVNNLGPNNATGVYLTNIIPTGTVFSSSPVSLSQGSYTTGGLTAICNLGTISNGASAIVTIQAIATGTGMLTNTAIVAATSTDLNPGGTTNILVTPVQRLSTSLSAAAFSDGSFHLTINGYAGQSYAIQTSTNLQTWTTVTTNSGSFTYIDTTLNAQKRFYRAIQLTQ